MGIPVIPRGTQWHTECEVRVGGSETRFLREMARSVADNPYPSAVAGMGHFQE
jgi:hypothetical protein